MKAAKRETEFSARQCYKLLSYIRADDLLEIADGILWIPGIPEFVSELDDGMKKDHKKNK